MSSQDFNQNGNDYPMLILGQVRQDVNGLLDILREAVSNLKTITNNSKEIHGSVKDIPFLIKNCETITARLQEIEKTLLSLNMPLSEAKSERKEIIKTLSNANASLSELRGVIFDIKQLISSHSERSESHLSSVNQIILIANNLANKMDIISPSVSKTNETLEKVDRKIWKALTYLGMLNFLVGVIVVVMQYFIHNH